MPTDERERCNALCPPIPSTEIRCELERDHAGAHRAESVMELEARAAAAEQRVAELEEMACQPRGECPVCGGETDHHPNCEVGILTRTISDVEAALASLPEADQQRYRDAQKSIVESGRRSA